MTPAGVLDEAATLGRSAAAAESNAGEPVPVVFEGCFGWLHPGWRPHGVVLCAPVGREGTWTYRAWAALATDIAAQGFPTLRFDYPGLGDSVDLDTRADAVEPWLASIAAAGRWLVRHADIGAVSLVGYRLGALLAAEAAHAVPALRSVVLLEPVHAGAAYLRELRFSAANPGQQYMAMPTALEPGALEVHGHVFSAATLDHLARLDAGRLAGAYMGETLILSDSAGNAAERLLERLRAADRRARADAFPDASLLQGAAHEIAVPAQTFAAVALWLAEQADAAPPDRPAPCRIGEPVLAVPAGSERPVRFGPQGALFGILACPESRNPGEPVALILNTGGNHRAGEARLGVRLARGMLAEGIASLRIDISGIGDALPLQRAPFMGFYAAQGRADARSALDWLDAHLPGPVAAVGLCSGAYDAFHCAVEDERIAAVVAVNMQKFIWREGDSFDVELGRRILHADAYRAGLRQKETWLRLARGEIAVGKIASGLLLRRWASARNAAQRALPSGIVIAPEMARVNALLRRLVQRRVRLLLVAGEIDPARSEIETFYGPDGRHLARLPGVEVRILPELDHTVVATSSKERLLALVLPFLHRIAR